MKHLAGLECGDLYCASVNCSMKCSAKLNVLEIDSEIQEQSENLVLENSEQTNQRVSMHQAGTTHTVHLIKTAHRNLKLEARKN